MNTREEMEAALANLIERADAMAEEDPMRTAEQFMENEGVAAFLDKYAPALVNDARWRAVCDEIDGGHASIETDLMMGGARTAEEAEQFADEWIARKAKEEGE